MIYARVVRALGAAGEGPDEYDHDGHCALMADCLNREFERMGIQVEPEELQQRSALEIAEVITGKLTA